MSAKHTNQTGPKTAFGRFMVYKFIPQYANNVQGLVYMGAAFLIIIVGLRGLGTVAYTISIVPPFLLDSATHKVSANWVMIALFLEFTLLMTLAVVTMFTPEDMGAPEPSEHGHQGQSEDIVRIKQALSELKEVADEDLKVLNTYIEQINNVNKKLVQTKADFFKSLTELKTLFK
ncbi:MAG: hypothetical protein LWX56_08165 [Ignavibacteria bacterium]|nr:hypothetical protein [Ignavibacteria bacterium]